MSRKADCIDNAATEQLFGHVKDEFYRGPRVEDVRGFQTRPGGIHSPLEHEPEAGKIEGPVPEGVPESGPRGLVAIKGFQDLGRSS